MRRANRRFNPAEQEMLEVQTMKGGSQPGREFPTKEETDRILEFYQIDTTDLIQKCFDLICEKTGHKWELSWPLDPEEYTCSRCGKKTLK